MPGKQRTGDKREESVFLTTWYQDWPQDAIQLDEADSFDQSFWEQVIKARDAVNKELEIKRNEGKIRAPLDADVTLYCSDDLAEHLSHLGDELRFIFITQKQKLNL